MPRGDWLLALGCALLTLATRIPFRAHLLPTWDAVQFALALREYDVVKHQPHPPGYILYVGAGRLVAAALGDATAALTWLAILASAVTVLLVYRLAFRLYGRWTALTAAVGLVASPLFWFYGVVGLSYTAEAALATAVAAATWALRGGDRRALAWSALLLALAGGVRQSILVVLLPLWVGMAWLGVRRLAPVLAGLGLMALASATWLIPMIVLTGGFDRYAAAAAELYDSTVRATTLLGPHWLSNWTGIAVAIVLGVGVLLPVLGGLLLQAIRRRPRWSPTAVFFTLWILPPLAVYGGVHFGQQGYLLTILPACYILIARGLVRAGRRLAPAAGPSWLRRVPAAALLAGVVVVHGAFFAAADPVDVTFPPRTAAWAERWPADLRAFYRFRIWANTAGGLRQHEDVIAGYVEAIRDGFDPADTALVTELGNPRSYPWFRHVMYYLPEFTVYHLRLGDLSRGYLTSQHAETMSAQDDPEIVLPASIRQLIWVVDHWNPQLPRPRGLVARPLPYGRWLYVLRLDRQVVEHAGYRLTPVTALARRR
jgi:hypothetical protein